jgi:hypothetical protein
LDEKLNEAATTEAAKDEEYDDKPYNPPASAAKPFSINAGAISSSHDVFTSRWRDLV